ncbi:hypothetical protein E4T56_gene19979 [Termitomyces sp. T112]|nr:hypothetical protein E4T56_gene19979 [Termitomyces sp. T112]
MKDWLSQANLALLLRSNQAVAFVTMPNIYLFHHSGVFKCDPFVELLPLPIFRFFKYAKVSSVFTTKGYNRSLWMNKPPLMLFGMPLWDDEELTYSYGSCYFLD